MTKDNLPYVFSVVFSVFVAFSTLEADTPDQNIKVQNSVFYEVPITWIKLVRVLRNTVNVWDHMSRVTSRCLEQFKWSACDSTVLLSRFFFSTGFGRVFSGSHGIWLKYRAGCGKMWDLLTGYGIWLLHRGSDRDSLKSWRKNGIRERDDRSVGFGFDLTKKWESGIREVTRLSRSIFPRWSKEQVIFLVIWVWLDKEMGKRD